MFKAGAFATLTVVSLAVAAHAEPGPAAKPTIAKICTNCHKAEPQVLRGYLDNVSIKSKAMQIRMDEAVEVLGFDDKAIQVITKERTSGNGELFKDGKAWKGHEVRVEYAEKNGVKTALKLTAKPPVELPKEMLISVDEVAKLVKQGPAKGNYFLFDSRPAPRFQEGAIPTAVNLPFPAFDKMAEKLLPADKNALLIFYCSGVTCNMSPGSAAKAKKLGYTTIKVFKEGMPAWSEKHYGVLSAQSLKEAWLDKGLSFVLLDARPSANNGFITGAVAFPAAKSKALVKALDLKQKKAPIVIYDKDGGKDAAKVAEALLKAGYGNVKVLTGGFAAWQEAKYEAATGKPAVKVVYVPKLKPGEIAVDEFKRYAEKLPDNVMIVDVRLPSETSAGMIKTAKAVPLVEIRDRLADLPKDKLIVLQCNTGTQAEIAYNTLKELGYANIKYLNAKVTFDKKGGYSITND